MDYKNRSYDVWENGKMIYSGAQIDLVIKLMQENGAPLIITPHSESTVLKTERWRSIYLSKEELELMRENSNLLDDLMKSQDELADARAQLGEAQAALHYMRHLYEQLESKYAEVKRVYKQMEEALK